MSTNIRIDSKIKEQVTPILNALGISLSQAVNMYLHQIKLQNGIPFALSLDPSAAVPPADKDSEPKGKILAKENHIVFLTGPRQIGKSTVIRKTISLLQKEGPLRLGGFFTYWGAKGDSHLYIAAADPSQGQNPSPLADCRNGSLIHHTEVFDQQSLKLLPDSSPAHLICMDELGFLEADSPLFKGRVYSCLDSDKPVIGVLREGEIPWHDPIKTHPRVTLCEVTLDNRDHLPAKLAAALRPHIRK